MKINLIAFWLFQLPFAYLAAVTFQFGATGVFLARVMAEVFLSLMAIFWFRKGHWKRMQV
jgi:Na+-driven multidrug efflux pump